ncbi:MAG: hypothetical protein BWX56_01393 [Euryarchaeota archaeon ADurb.Bin023]|nr:MAG: hypothetical protein BWX56_01393 [Euryarchaeota archaeon ADurb.Bin023]
MKKVIDRLYNSGLKYLESKIKFINKLEEDYKYIFLDDTKRIKNSLNLLSSILSMIPENRSTVYVFGNYKWKYPYINVMKKFNGRYDYPFSLYDFLRIEDSYNILLSLKEEKGINKELFNRFLGLLERWKEIVNYEKKIRIQEDCFLEYRDGIVTLDNLRLSKFFSIDSYDVKNLLNQATLKTFNCYRELWKDHIEYGLKLINSDLKKIDKDLEVLLEELKVEENMLKLIKNL